MSYPTPYTVGWHVRTNTGPDRYREPATYSPPKDQPGTPVPVIQWSAAKSDDSGSDGRQQLGYERVVLSVDLFVPPGFTPKRGDLIDLPAGPVGQFEIVGAVEDYNHGFHGWHPGSVVNLRRVEG